jgi:hypothetical protein
MEKLIFVTELCSRRLRIYHHTGQQAKETYSLTLFLTSLSLLLFSIVKIGLQQFS